MSAPLKVGIVGCGEVTQVMHLPSLWQLPESFDVVALCDVSVEVLDAVGQQWNVKQRFKDYRDLLGSGIDVVLIANPDAYHAEVLLAAMEAGKHVLVEKPMCLNLREADEIIAMQKRTAVTVQVGYMRRYASAFIKACQLVTELRPIRLARVHDVIGGNHLFVQATSRVFRSQPTTDEASRLKDKGIVEAIGECHAAVRNAYGLMLGLSSHDISAMRELLGTPHRVLYAAQRLNGLYLTAAFDYGDFVCHYETGIDQIPRFDAHVEVYGETEVVKVEYDTPYIRNLPVRVSLTKANGQGGAVAETELPAWGDAFVAEWKVFYDSVIEKKESKTSAADFREDLVLFKQMARLMAES